MQTDIKSKCLEFLYAQVSKGNMPQIRKGMVEDLEGFIEGLRADEKAHQMAKRFEQISKEVGTAKEVDSEQANS